MSRKITAIFITICIMLSSTFVPTLVLAANSPLSYTVAEETFAAGTDYKKSWGTQLNSSYVDATKVTGTGWGSNWLTKDANGDFVAPTNSNITTYPAISSNADMALRVKVQSSLYRPLKTPISFNNAEGTYTFSFGSKSALSGAGNSRGNVAVKFGSSFAIGYKWNSTYNKVIPCIEINGDTFLSTAETTMVGGDSGAYTTITATVELNKDAVDVITLEAKYSSTDKATVTTTAEISGIVEELIFTSHNTYFDNIKLTYDNPSRYETYSKIINGEITDDNSIIETFEFLGNYAGSNKDALLSALKDATATNPVREVKLTSMSPEKGTTYISKYAHEINKIDLAYNYALENGAEFGIYNKTTNATTPVATGVAVLNTVSIPLPDGLENGVQYVIKTEDTDFKGDSVPEVTFVTSPIGEINVTDNCSFSQGAKIKWEANGGEVTASIKDLEGNTVVTTDDGSLYNEYVLDIFGNYTFDFSVTKNGYTDALTNLAFVVEQDYAPVASNVRIEGTVGFGETLTAKFDYYDANNDAPGDHIIVWYKLNGEDKTEIGRGETYKIKYRDKNSDIVVGVIPVSTSVINPEGESEEFSDPLRISYLPTAISSDAFYEKIAEETIAPQDYNKASNDKSLSESYTLDSDGKAIITGSGWLANWVVNGPNNVFVPLTDANKALYYRINSVVGEVIKINNMPADTMLYRQLAKTIDLNSNYKYTFSIDVQDGSSAAGGTKFRYKIGNSIVVGYDYNSDNTKVIPVLEVNGVSVENTATLTMGKNGGDESEFMTFTTTVELNSEGLDTVTLVAHDRGASVSAERVTISVAADLTGLVEYVGVGTVPGATTLLRVDNFKVEGSNPARLDEISDIIANGTEDAEELKSAIADLAEYNGSDKAELIASLKDLATGDLTGADVIELLNISEDIENPLLVSELSSFEFDYNFKLGNNVTFGVYKNDTAVAGVTSEVNGKNVKITLSDKLENGVEYKIKATGTDFKDDSIPDISFRTSAIPDINVSNGGHYGEQSKIIWNENGTAIDAILKDAEENEETISNEYIVMNPGCYVLTITATKNGFTDTVVMNITFDEDIAPVVSNVRIEGIAATDEILEAKYNYYDANNDAEGTHIIEWYKITADGDVKIGDGATYQLTEEEENCDLYVKFKPVALSIVDPEGEWVTGALFKGAYKPSAADVKISGDILADAEIEVEYLYSDANGDEEGASVVKWYVKGDVTDTEIVNNITDGKLTIKEELFGTSVYATLTPVSAKKPYNGDTITTSVVLMPAKPVVSNVRIEGNTGINDVLTAYYNFEDINLDAEGTSKYEWKDSNGTVLGTDRKLTITSGLLGKTITVTVIGVSPNAPTDSLPVTSASVTIPNAYYGGIGGGSSGGGGGGGYGYTGATSGSPEIKEEPTEKPEEPAQNKVFKDLENHWSANYVNTLLEKEIVAKDENFRPDDRITRAEVLALLFRSSGEELSKYNGVYGDVNEGDWFADYIQTAMDKGIISQADNFRPNDSITREETAKMITLMLGLKSEKQAEFSDFGTLSDWAIEYVNAVYEAGIFKGDDNKNFNGKSSLTRAETATVIHRLLTENAFSKEVLD